MCYCLKTSCIVCRVHAKSLQSCLTLCHPMDCRPPGSSVLGLLQARILEWVAIPSPGKLHIWYLSFSVWLISLSIISSKSIHVVTDGKISFFSWLSNVPLCVCVSMYIEHLYPFIYQWELRLLPYLGYCKHCFNEHTGTCISFFGSGPCSGIAGSHSSSSFSFFEELPCCFP